MARIRLWLLSVWRLLYGRLEARLQGFKDGTAAGSLPGLERLLDVLAWARGVMREVW